MFTYPVAYDNKEFGVIEVPVGRSGPCVPIRSLGERLTKHVVYFRRNSQNDFARTAEDHQFITGWFLGKRGMATRNFSSHAWDTLFQAVHGFDPAHRYILVADHQDSQRDLHALGRLPLSAVFDFDPDSETTGLLGQVKAVLERSRSLHLGVRTDRPNGNLGRATYWFFARGLRGRDDSLAVGPWREWAGRYQLELTTQFRELARSMNPTPVTILVLWNSDDLIPHLRSTLEAAVGAFGDTVDFALVAPTATPAMTLLGDTLSAPTIELPTTHLAAGIDTCLPEANTDADRCILPSFSGAPISVGPEDLRWIEEEFELLHQGVGQRRVRSDPVGREFLRGNEITWYELGLHCDVDRDKAESLRRQVRLELDARRTARLNLYHAPGAGGTTTARRLLWDLHGDFPSAILRSTIPSDTAERAYRIASQTGLPVLLMVDGGDVTEREIDDLYTALKSRNIPTVLLQVLRRFTERDDAERSFYLPSQLSAVEARRFADILSREVPERQSALFSLLSGDGRARTAFYFGLQAFGRDFVGLERYVHVRLAPLSPVQAQLLGHFAFAHRYAQRPLPAQVFARLLGLPSKVAVRISDVLPSGALELLIEVQHGEWRTSHDLVAQEILEQLLTPTGQDRRLWRQGLSKWAKDFARICRGESEIASDELTEVARRVFILRDNVELLGTERASTRSFAQLIEEMPVREAALDTLKTLVSLYPDEPHFLAHLARYHAVQMQNYDEAIKVIKAAIMIQPSDHVLHHMHGMILRYQLYDLIEGHADSEAVLALAELAGTAFQCARDLRPDDDHSYISEIQMITRVLDYCTRGRADGIVGYAAIHPGNTFVREGLQRAEELLDQVRRNRDGEAVSRYEAECRARLDVLYGQHDRALQVWDQLLGRRDIYPPPIRRQIVWTYFNRRGQSWMALTDRERERVADLLGRNLREEPQNDANYRMWIRAVRLIKQPPSIDTLIEQVAYWK